jgi:hypothetical protein
MKRVYVASDLIDAQLLADSLTGERIDTHLFNANAVGAMGDIPFANTWPEVWIANDRDSARAEAVVLAHSTRRVAAGSLCCAACGEDNPSTFDTCWRCGGTLEGIVPTGPVDAQANPRQ